MLTKANTAFSTFIEITGKRNSKKKADCVIIVILTANHEIILHNEKINVKTTLITTNFICIGIGDSVTLHCVFHGIRFKVN